MSDNNIRFLEDNQTRDIQKICLQRIEFYILFAEVRYYKMPMSKVLQTSPRL